MTTTTPNWNLNDLYTGINDPKIEQDITTLKKDIQAFNGQYEGMIATLDASALAAALTSYEAIQEAFNKLYCYAFLLFAEEMTHTENKQFYQTTKESLIAASSALIFFTLELNDLKEDHIDGLIKENDILQKYAPWIKDVRVSAPYQLPKDQETLLYETHIASHGNWVRLHEETFARIQFDYQGQKLSASDILNKFSDPDEAVRKEANMAFAAGLKANIDIFGLAYNTLMKAKAIEDKWRGYKAPISSRNVANLVEDPVVDTLLTTVRENYPDLSHRYYKLKAKWFGKQTLPIWERNAPLPKAPLPEYNWAEAKETVLTAYRHFSPTMADIGQRFFDENWIDATPRNGKDSGAFSASCVPSVHPYILMNFHGKVRDVATLAHELGHGVHQYLSREQGMLMSDTPLTIAETASVFGEMLTFQHMLSQAQSEQAKKAMLASKVEDMLNTVVRQIAFCSFEEKCHALRAEKELSTQDFNALWLEVQKESLGTTFDYHEDMYQYYWAYISHFIHTPFYVYAYAFGDCLVNALYETYQSGFPDFEPKYLDLLRAGGSQRYDQLLRPFNLDARKKDFWQRGLNVIKGMIDQLEALSS